MRKKPGKSQLLGKKGNGKGNIGAGTLVANTLMGEMKWIMGGGRGKRKPIHFRSTRIPGQAEVTESSEEKREEKKAGSNPGKRVESGGRGAREPVAAAAAAGLNPLTKSLSPFVIG
jgi:hypothetical protein